MNLVADESVDRQIVEQLRRDGHSIWYVPEMDPGIPDDAVLDLANREMAVLLTADKGFGELAFRQGRLTAGIVLIRLVGLSANSKAALVARAVAEHHPNDPRSGCTPWSGGCGGVRPDLGRCSRDAISSWVPR